MSTIHVSNQSKLISERCMLGSKENSSVYLRFSSAEHYSSKVNEYVRESLPTYLSVCLLETCLC